MNIASRRHRAMVGLATMALAAACGGDPAGPGTPVPPPPSVPPPPAGSEITLALAANSGTGQDGIPGRPLGEPLRVVVRQDGSPLPGVALSWTTSSGSIVGDGPTDANGVAMARWTLGGPTTGVRSARASLVANPSSTVEFLATAINPVFAVIGADHHEVEVGSVIPVPLRARLTWRGEPMAGEPIDWLGGMVTPVADATDAAGEIFATWQVGETAGLQAVGAKPRDGSFNGPVATFHATVRPGQAASLQWIWASTGTPVHQAISRRSRGSEVTIEYAIRATDRFGNAVAGTPVSLMLRTARGTVDLTVPGHTDAAGVARWVPALIVPGASEDIVMTGSADGLPSISFDYLMYDFLYTKLDDGLNQYFWWPTTTTTVRAGTTVRLIRHRPPPCPFRLSEVLADGAVRDLGDVGAPAPYLELPFDTPGSFRLTCNEPSAPPHVLTVEVTP